MGQDHSSREAKSVFLRFPKWVIGIIVVLALICGILCLGIFALPALGFSLPEEILARLESYGVLDGSESEPEGLDSVITDMLNLRGEGNADPKLDAGACIPAHLYGPPELNSNNISGNENIVWIEFLEPTLDELPWKMNMQHPDIFEEGEYQLQIFSKTALEFSEAKCQVQNGVLNCSFNGFTPRLSNTQVDVIVTKDNCVVASFWGTVSEGDDKQAENNGSQPGGTDAPSVEVGESCIPVDLQNAQLASNDSSILNLGEIDYGGNLDLKDSFTENGLEIKNTFSPTPLWNESGQFEEGYQIHIFENLANTDTAKEHQNNVDCSLGNGSLTCELAALCPYGEGVCSNIIVVSQDDCIRGAYQYLIRDLDENPNSTADARCTLYKGMEMELAWPEWKKDSPMPVTIKMPGGVPGLEIAFPDDVEPWEYSLKIGTSLSNDCTYQGYKEKLHCAIVVSEGYSESVQTLSLFVNGCSTPILYKDKAYLPEMQK
ncbi:MAG: hypothetical protein ISR59_01215 [Anaerolineales bacterium]|uniref:Uncharacterized protein n=1 Tax=Candidatus Desulfolinea nitratireducens TaxID=2841698 RepID=A0A8J6NL10_9CHLR|nr:hypothetical protein [Candidatus Desulfolinea nitratireducens]MBL6959698.1 hypothetical protein [Anaerolineales bacterium]